MSVRVAVWSPPRSLSTAMMRSWSSRKDTTVVDEPFYGAWLQEQPESHPGTKELLTTLNTDRHAVAEKLRVGSGTAIQYEKQITQHVSVPFVKAEMQGVRHAFLIRHPARQLTSLDKVLTSFSLEVSGWPMLEELFTAFGGGAPVVDADDLGREPARVLRLLCAALSVEFSDSMLSWNRGAHPAEGSWATNWYQAVQSSQGFTKPGPRPEVSPRLRAHYERALVVYERLYALRLQ